MIVQRATCWAAVCDVPSCHAELIAPDEAGAGEDASLAGWAFRPDGKLVCQDCQRGPGRTAAARTKAMYGAEEVQVASAPRDFADGEEVHGPDGSVAGYAKAAKAGEPMTIRLVAPPAPNKPPEAVEAAPESAPGGGPKIEQAPTGAPQPSRTRWRPD